MNAKIKLIVLIFLTLSQVTKLSTTFDINNLIYYVDISFQLKS